MGKDAILGAVIFICQLLLGGIGAVLYGNIKRHREEVDKLDIKVDNLEKRFEHLLGEHESIKGRRH